MFVKHIIADGAPPGPPVPPFDPAAPYEYIMHAGGILLRAERKELSVCLPLAGARVRDLREVKPRFELRADRVPAALVSEIMAHAITAVDGRGRLVESLFHLIWHGAERRWELVVPEQVRARSSVYPVDDGPGSSYQRALVEVHSHHELAFGPRFSPTDDEDETLFRVYAVLGDITRGPALRTRVGVHQQFVEIPSACVFEMPAGLRDCVADECRAAAEPLDESEEEGDERR